MKLNVERVEELLRKRGWSEYYLSQKLRLTYSYVWRVMRGKRGIGNKFTGALMRLCQKEGLEFTEFVIVDGGERQ